MEQKLKNPTKITKRQSVKAVALRRWLVAFRTTKNKEPKICKDCVHSVEKLDLSCKTYFMCNRKHKIHIVTGEPTLTPCLNERYSGCGIKAKYFIAKKEHQETDNKKMKNGK